MLNIAICDDDIQITGKIERLLQDIAKRNFVDTEIEVFWNGKSLADAIAAGERYDVIYLDIEMDKEDGISAARRIRTYDKNVRIIYVTSHESYMRESFEVRPFQFLVKPVTDKIMEKCFKSVYEDINSEDFYFRYTPVYNFINDRFVDESAVLRPLSWHLILYVFRYFSRKWQTISDCECPDLIQNETPVRFLYGTQKNVRSDRAESSWHSN